MRSLIGAILVLIAAALTGTGAARAQGTESQTRQQVLVLLSLPPQHFRPDGNYAGSYSDAAGRVARRRVAVQLASEHGLAMTGDWPMPLLGVDCFVMNVPPDRSPDHIAQDLSRDARVSWAQKNGCSLSPFFGSFSSTGTFVSMPWPLNWKSS